MRRYASWSGDNYHGSRMTAQEGTPDHRRAGKSCGAAGDKPRRRDKLLKAADELAKHVGVKPACAALEVSRSTLYTSSRPINRATAAPNDARPGIERDGTRRGLRHAVFGAVRGAAHPPRWWPRCSTKRSTCAANAAMYRALASEVPVQVPPAQSTHPEYKKPELMATAPNQVVALGYHAAARAEEVELLLPLRHHETSTAATSWAGWWRTGRTRPWPAG